MPTHLIYMNYMNTKGETTYSKAGEFLNRDKLIADPLETFFQRNLNHSKWCILSQSGARE